MSNYEFKLTPAYCLYNGAAVMEQNGAYIKFITEGNEDSVLHARLEKAFRRHVASALEQKDCDDSFRRIPKIVFTQGSHEEVRNYVSRLYREGAYGKKEDILEKKLEENQKKEAAAIVLLDSILDEARKKNATDIHIEKNLVRMRINGGLEDYAFLQKERTQELVLRIKLLAGMNVLEKRRSQDGRFVFGQMNPVFVRVSTVGIVGNSSEESEESVVMRLLDTGRLPLGLMNLGFSEPQLFRIEEMNRNKNGLILICGPTGSGKSTTAASILMERVRKSKGSEKIISLEDPPEYIVPGVTQVKIEPEIGVTYENILEKVFRQDPDIIMIGEIRNTETARVALRASMTGHLVIATLHTESAFSSVYRLMDLGCDESVLRSVLRGVIMQELDFKLGSATLFADIAVPDFQNEEDGFDHVTNVPELISKTSRSFKKRMIPFVPEKTKVRKEVVNE